MGSGKTYVSVNFRMQENHLEFQKKAPAFAGASEVYLISSETLKRFLPFARRALSTFLPLTLDILFLNPCLFLRFLFDG